MARLVLIGSGETAPTLIKVHRELLRNREIVQPGDAVMVDTTFSFQTNADDLVTKTTRYFAESVGLPVSTLHWPHRDLPPLERARAVAGLLRARWVFAGPGSPSHAVAQWQNTDFAEALGQLAQGEATLVFGSAAACTTGAMTLPVYEIYKAGQAPFLLDGLDLLHRLSGLSALVIPHFNNAEGESYDTRFCYLGEQRLGQIRAKLPAGTGVLGIDEHTAVVIEPDDTSGRRTDRTGTLRVLGHGGITLIGPDPADPGTVIPAGETITFAQAAALLRGETARQAEPGEGSGRRPNDGLPDTTKEANPNPTPDHATSLAEITLACQNLFDAAAARGDAEECGRAVLELDHAIEDWSTDSLQGPDAANARRTLRSLISRLADMATNGPQVQRKVTEAITALVNELIQARDTARADRDFKTADAIRHTLDATGITLSDSPQGTTWQVR